MILGGRVFKKQRRQWQPTPVLLPGKSHGRRSLIGCSPWGREESDTTEQLHFHFSLSCTREGNGNPLQCSCLENPRDGGAWWAAVYVVSQSRTWLKQLSSSSSSKIKCSKFKGFLVKHQCTIRYLDCIVNILHYLSPLIWTWTSQRSLRGHQQLWQSKVMPFNESKSAFSVNLLLSMFVI